VEARKLTSGNQRATALSLAAKGSVVAEKRRTRCPFKRPFPHPGNALYNSVERLLVSSCSGESQIAGSFENDNKALSHGI
jgi:hypothetical protein